MAAAEVPAKVSRAVLLVEPDEGMRWALELILVEMGYQVQCARDSREAIRCATESTGPPDLIVAEFHLPDFSGAVLTRQLRAQGNPVPVLLVSWDSREQLCQMGIDPGTCPLLKKPIHLHDFTRLVRALLSRNLPDDRPPNATPVPRQ